jgi:predicted nucleic-acid-binding protein
VKLLDSNILIRFLAQDDFEKSEQVEKLFKEARKQELQIPDFILTEIVWVLISFYKLRKDKVIEKLEGILSFKKFKINRLVLRKAIDIYRNYNISFVDAYLCALGVSKKRGIYSFDKKLRKTKGVKFLKT